MSFGHTNPQLLADFDGLIVDKLFRRDAGLQQCLVDRSVLEDFDDIAIVPCAVGAKLHRDQVMHISDTNVLIAEPDGFSAGGDRVGVLVFPDVDAGGVVELPRTGCIEVAGSHHVRIRGKDRLMIGNGDEIDIFRETSMPVDHRRDAADQGIRDLKRREKFDRILHGTFERGMNFGS